jgi:hypothetical protein
MRSNDSLTRRKKKRRLILDVDSTEDPAPGKPENVAFNGHFGKNCFHPLFAFTSNGDCLGAQVRPGNVHSADGILDFIDPYLTGPVGRPPKSGIYVKLVDLWHRAQIWNKKRRVVATIEWHDGELFRRIGFICTNSRLPAAKVVNVYNGRGDVENRINKGKNTLRWDKPSCRRFAANQARLLMGVLASNLPRFIREFYLKGEEVKQSIEWLIERLIEFGAGVCYHARSWLEHVASAFQ